MKKYYEMTEAEKEAWKEELYNAYWSEEQMQKRLRNSKHFDWWYRWTLIAMFVSMAVALVL